VEGLPILQKNAYLTILIKDNGLYANLAYTDYANDNVYILNDYTDLYPLKRKLDDHIFGIKFWEEYFNALEKEWDWDIVERSGTSFFKFLDFQDEYTGLTGIKVVIDDNQRFFRNIYDSLKQFSNEIAIRVADDTYIKELMALLSEKLQYDDILHIDMDLPEFSVYRYKKGEFSKGIISWSSEIALIDAIKNSKIQALMSTDVSSDEIMNKYANFVSRPYKKINDPILSDILRAFCTVQNLTIYNENKKKLFGVGWQERNTAVIVTGRLMEVLGEREILLSLIDGFELLGDFDLYTDKTGMIYSYGRSMSLGKESYDVILARHEVLPKATKVYLPELHAKKSKNKVVFQGSLSSMGFDRDELFSINPEISIFEIPETNEKVVFEGKLVNGAEMVDGDNTRMTFVSSRESTLYGNLVVDARIKPIVYGPDAYANRNKLKTWFDEGKR
jgi:hypothetical protein